MYGQLISQKYKDTSMQDSEITRYVNVMVDASARMSRLIDDLLAYSRLDHDVDELQETVDMNDVLGTVLHDLNVLVAATNAHITADALPVVHAPRFRIHQLLQNLISNAIKYHGEKKPQIQISGRRADNGWLVEVSDNGIGIDSKYRDEVFKPLRRLHREPQGTGMGLAICKKIVEERGGKIWCQSYPGAGSTFSFTIPDPA